MKFTVTMALGLASSALAQGQNSTFATSTAAASSSITIVSALTTVCDSATILTQNGAYYTCTEDVTLTITDCPCTMTNPAYAVAPTASTSITTTIIAPTCASIAATQAAPNYAPYSCPGASSPGYTPPALGTSKPPGASASQSSGYLYTNGAASSDVSAVKLVALVGLSALYALSM